MLNLSSKQNKLYMFFPLRTDCMLRSRKKLKNQKKKDKFYCQEETASEIDAVELPDYTFKFKN